ncbi:unnamed protein product [Pleuronectes platessa]|uniref:Uncharacterized protein n=1 Tax=Pleuronectes platessa TaxID=8262 RepID=A0A9N7VT51_PLEPL|nr:unnamed protein product [Pleuronectes platessa]
MGGQVSCQHVLFAEVEVEVVEPAINSKKPIYQYRETDAWSAEERLGAPVSKMKRERGWEQWEGVEISRPDKQAKDDQRVSRFEAQMCFIANSIHFLSLLKFCMARL